MSNYSGGGSGFPPTSGQFTGSYTTSGPYPPSSAAYSSSSMNTPGAGGYAPAPGAPPYAPTGQYYQPPPHGHPSHYSQPPYGQMMPGPPVPPHASGGYPPQHSYQPYPPQPVQGYPPPGYSAPGTSQMAQGFQQHVYPGTQPSVAPDYSQHPQAPIAREAFVNVDTDRNGYLDLKEFIRAMRIVKPNIEYKDALDFFARGDRDQSGRIGLNEFIAVYIEEILPLTTY